MHIEDEIQSSSNIYSTMIHPGGRNTLLLPCQPFHIVSVLLVALYYMYLHVLHVETVSEEKDANELREDSSEDAGEGHGV